MGISGFVYAVITFHCKITTFQLFSKLILVYPTPRLKAHEVPLTAFARSVY